MEGEKETTTNSESEEAWLPELAPGTRMSVELKRQRWRRGGKNKGGGSTKKIRWYILSGSHNPENRSKPNSSHVQDQLAQSLISGKENVPWH